MAGLVILALFIALPIAEIMAFIEVGAWIGGIATIGATIATAFAGAVLFRLQGLATLARARESLDQGVMPLEQVISGLGLLLAALCLFVPGFVTDFIGFLLFIPPVRTLVMAGLLRSVMTRGQVHVAPGGAHFHASFRDHAQSDDVIDGEYEDISDRDVQHARFVDQGPGTQTASDPTQANDQDKS